MPRQTFAYYCLHLIVKILLNVSASFRTPKGFSVEFSSLCTTQDLWIPRTSRASLGTYRRARGTSQIKYLSSQCVLSLFLLLISLSLFSEAHANHWRDLAPGVEYIDIGANLLTPWSHVHVFRIDLKKNQLELVMANALSQPHASVNEFAHYSKALLSINGGFFDHNFHPLGLRISHQQQYSPLKRISWWGIFYIEHQKPRLSSVGHYKSNPNVDFAVQSGPRLLVKGRIIPSLKAGYAERTALGISPDEHVLVLVTDNTPMTTMTLATLMQSPPLNCKDALNLDGGSSSQLYAHIDSFRVNVHGFSNVSDGIIVKPRK